MGGDLAKDHSSYAEEAHETLSSSPDREKVVSRKRGSDRQRQSEPENDEMSGATNRVRRQ